MYRLRSAPVVRRDTWREAGMGPQQELDRLREENARLQCYREATQPILANLVLNPFSEIDELRKDARAALALARRGSPVDARIVR